MVHRFLEILFTLIRICSYIHVYDVHKIQWRRILLRFWYRVVWQIVTKVLSLPATLEKLLLPPFCPILLVFPLECLSEFRWRAINVLHYSEIRLITVLGNLCWSVLCVGGWGRHKNYVETCKMVYNKAGFFWRKIPEITKRLELSYVGRCDQFTYCNIVLWVGLINLHTLA